MTDTTKAAALAEQLRAGENFYAESSLWYDSKLANSVDDAADLILAQAARIAELEANGVHSCHPECPRPVCVLQRRVAELEAERAGLVAAERERCAKLCEFWDATHPKRLAEEIRRVGAA